MEGPAYNLNGDLHLFSVPEHLKTVLDITEFPNAPSCGEGGYAIVKKLVCTNDKAAAVKKIVRVHGTRDVQVVLKAS